MRLVLRWSDHQLYIGALRNRIPAFLWIVWSHSKHSQCFNYCYDLLQCRTKQLPPRPPLAERSALLPRRHWAGPVKTLNRIQSIKSLVVCSNSTASHPRQLLEDNGISFEPCITDNPKNSLQVVLIRNKSCAFSRLTIKIHHLIFWCLCARYSHVYARFRGIQFMLCFTDTIPKDSVISNGLPKWILTCMMFLCEGRALLAKNQHYDLAFSLRNRTSSGVLQVSRW